MQITPELLERYQTGNCSEEEKNAVRRWLHSIDEEESSISAYSLRRMESNIWTSLSGRNQNRNFVGTASRVRYTRIARYAVAASVILALGWFGMNKYDHPGSDSNIAIKHNAGGPNHFVHTSGLDLTLLPGSDVKVTSNHDGTEESMGFCGKIAFTSHIKRNVQLTATSSCDGFPWLGRNIQLEQGYRYVAFQLGVKKNVFVVNIDKPMGELHQRIAKEIMYKVSGERI